MIILETKEKYLSQIKRLWALWLVWLSGVSTEVAAHPSPQAVSVHIASNNNIARQLVLIILIETFTFQDAPTANSLIELRIGTELPLELFKQEI